MANKEDLFVWVGPQQEEDRKLEVRKREEKRKKPYMAFGILIIIIIGTLLAPLWTVNSPTELYLEFADMEPSWRFIFGTDPLGRDIFSILWYGGRQSLCIGIGGAGIMACIGIIYGACSGLATEYVDKGMMRFAEMLGSVPQILLVLLLMSLFPHTNSYTIAFVAGITGWMTLARVVRMEVKFLRQQEYLLVSYRMGASFFYQVYYHIVPHIISPVMFIIISGISRCIILEATLSFLGLGLPVEIISWGTMLSLATRAILNSSWWIIVFPGIFMIITMWAITEIAHFFHEGHERKASNL